MKENEKLLQKGSSMNGDEEYIQLPPLERSLEGEAVSLIWEYAKLPQGKRDAVYHDLLVMTGAEGNAFEERKVSRKVELEEIKEYVDAIKELMRSMILEASSIATWVCAKKYMDGYTLEQMISELPEAESFIVVIDTFFEESVITSEMKYNN